MANARLSQAQYAALECLRGRIPGHERVKHAISTPRPNTLVALEILGFVTPDSSVNGGYRITPAGRARLHDHIGSH